MAVTTKRTSASLSTKLLDNLDFCAKNLGVTRSALINELLESPLSNIREVLEYSLPPVDDDSGVPVKRTSAEVSHHLRQHLSGLHTDLTSLENQLDLLGGASDGSSKH